MYNTRMRNIPREYGLYALALVIGLAVRLIGLGSLPLSDLEAGWALKALDISQGLPASPGSQPAYVVLTSGLFYAFGGASNVLARLVPALTGSALILVPALFIRQLKPRSAAILAFVIAVEPGLAAISRQAGSAILALTFSLAAVGLWQLRRFAWAGVCAGMALMSGPALWAGALGLAIGWALMRPFDGEEDREQKDMASIRQTLRGGLVTAALYGAGTIVLIGTLFMTAPAGLGTWVASLPEYVSGWTRLSGISIGVMLASLAAYQPLGMLLALVAITRGWLQRSRRVMRLSLWMVAALLLALFQPSRQVVDLAWMLVPMWALASLEVARNLRVRPGERREVLGAVALSFVILGFVWLNFLALRRPGIAPDQAVVRAWLLGGSFLLLAVSMLLVAAGWSIRIAQYGAFWGLAAFLGVYAFAALMSSTGQRQMPDAAEMWQPDAELPMAKLVLQTVEEQSRWSDKDAAGQPVTLAGLDSPAMRWLLRDRPLESRAGSGAAGNPPIVITPDVQDPALATAYRGQGLIWRSTPLWSGMQFLQWLPFHDVPRTSEKIIVWVRNDLFADARANTSP